MYKEFHQGIIAIAKCFNIDIKPLSREWTRIYQSRLSNRGKADAVKFMKQLNTVAERYALHQEIEPIPWTISDKDGYPKILGKFKTNLRSKDTLTVLFTISVMRSVETLRLPISQEIDTVTQPCGYDAATLEAILNFIPKWVKRLPPLHLPKMKYHLTTKNGPNGPALITSDSDISALMNCPKLLEAIQVVWSKLADKDLPDPEPVVSSTGTEIHSKLTQFPEKAGKTRTIAVIDYYSQMCLNPLHKGLMSLLANLESDGTYSHLNVGKFAKQATNDKSFIACADLTAATDRFPAEIQRVLLAELLKDSDLSNSLWTILADRTFTVAWSRELVTYNCGQPMGCHGSWPLFALAHHLIVEYACYLARVPNVKTRYRLIGDDVIINEEVVWSYYQSLMTNLGLTINLGKTVITSPSSQNSGAEVAKQLYLNGKCLTPLTPGFVKDLKKTYMFNSCTRVLMTIHEEFSTEAPSMLINTLFPKRKQKLVWLLASNPLTGIIKPGEPGYDELSPWDAELTANAKSKYITIFADSIAELAQKRLSENLRYVLTGGSPWKDQAPPPQCIHHVYKNIMYELRDCLNKLKVTSLESDLATLLETVSYVPDPSVPFCERKELASRTMSILVKRLYDRLISERHGTADRADGDGKLPPGIVGARVIGTVPIRLPP